MLGAGHSVLMRGMRNVSGITKFQWKNTLVRPRRRWKNNIKMTVIEMWTISLELRIMSKRTLLRTE
jgi:hypothetical protein